ncbi:MAG: copper chaperone PCu(A)C [Pseudomonadota bacterium]
MRFPVIAALLLPATAFADGIRVEDPFVPLAPPTARVHAAYITLTNDGAAERQLVSISADGYAMAHLHLSEEKDGVATMSSVDLIALAPGQTVNFEPGGLHIMLMGPANPLAEGETVSLTLEFANGETEAVDAMVMPLGHGAHEGHGS